MMAPLTTRPLSKEFSLSRLLRAGVFAFVVSVLLVGFTIVVISYVWNNWVRHAFGMGEYSIQLILIIPTIFVVTLIFAKILWDNSRVEYGQRVREPGAATWNEPTTHAKSEDRKRYDPNPSAEEKKFKTGPTGPKDYGRPSGGWDEPKLP